MPLLTIPEEEASIRFADLILESGINALLGYAVVFFGLILLMVVVILLGKAFSHKHTKPVGTGVPDGPNAPSTVGTGVPDGPVAPGAAGELKLHNVDPKTAAMLMAIVADKMQKPINELRFISVKEVE